MIAILQVIVGLVTVALMATVLSGVSIIPFIVMSATGLYLIFTGLAKLAK